MAYLAPAHSSRQELVTWINSLELEFEELNFEISEIVIMRRRGDCRQGYFIPVLFRNIQF